MIDNHTLKAFARGRIPLKEFIVKVAFTAFELRSSWPHLTRLLEEKGILLNYWAGDHSLPIIVGHFEQENDFEHDVIIIRQWQTLYTQAVYGRKKVHSGS